MTTPKDVSMPPKLRTALIWATAVFLVYAVVTSPDRSADVVRALWDVVTDAFASFAMFFQNLTS
ncbi:hypothetical protein [Cellulomonas sp. URHE0023]|uniref:hypothetical protein n=1 Tax=Cellulomonas sp. URHE0023 TaxID=1380354 RepID=UPI0012DE74EC|nr:hypothetical protein [Cellulomonas sp. URHE0023]